LKADDDDAAGAAGALSAGVLRARWLALTFPGVPFRLGGRRVRLAVEVLPDPRDEPGRSPTPD
jgi:hypothetical protein